MSQAELKALKAKELRMDELKGIAGSVEPLVSPRARPESTMMNMEVQRKLMQTEIELEGQQRMRSIQEKRCDQLQILFVT